jgi:pteridine reductase
MQLRGRVALVTGAGRRVGRAIAEALGADGARVAAHHHESSGGASEVVQAILAGGGEAAVFAADLSQPSGPEHLVANVAEHFGAIDVVINSAAVMWRTPFGTIDTDTWDRMFAINVRAPFFIAQAAARHMSQGGAIVNIADLAAFETWPDFVPHNITKAAVVHMTHTLARMLAPSIRVNAVAPGAVLMPENTPPETTQKMIGTTPLRRLGSPEDVVGAIRYLLSADYVTGETLIVDGGRHVRR